jgi:uncharacterized membrane protein
MTNTPIPGLAKTKREIIRVAGKLREIVTVHDEAGNILHKVMSPLMIEFYPRDVFQVIVGASILAIPVGFTEETWRLGETLPFMNVFGLFLISVAFVSLFAYYNYYRGRMKEHSGEFFKRVFSTYLFSFVMVAVLLTLIQRAPWELDWILAIKRIIIVTFPASMSAAVADMIK